MNTALLQKYDVAAPRYTSYPSVPYWTADHPDPEVWLDKVDDAMRVDRQISLYIHLPFCESLCTYCGCNKHITKNHAVENPYIQTVLREWSMYVKEMPFRPVLRELHLGGGTPTFFSPHNLRALIEPILADVDLPPGADFSFEAHPWSTTTEHLKTLYSLRFRRISVGVQDFDESLMKLVNRSQTVESVVRCIEEARTTGFRSVNIDLMYGLRRQTVNHIQTAADFVAKLLPERIAFSSYAHVPWFKKSQAAYSEADLPVGADKRLLYETGRRRFEEMGYNEIGMDHFALAHDSLNKALEHGTLHRNFMGYTPYSTRLMIGLGASAIGDTWDAFAQNEKTIADYERAVNVENRLPLFRGHFLSTEDQLIRKHILRLMTRFETDWFWPEEQTDQLSHAIVRLEPLAADGLVILEPFRVRVTPEGRAFLRNICMAFDAHYWKKQPEGKLFSQSV